MIEGTPAPSTGRALLRAIKATVGGDGPQLCLTVGHPPKALLRPVATDPAQINNQDVQRLTEWRNRFVTSFLTEFTATHDQTRDWLCQVVGPTDTKMLFMIDSPTGETFGYMGIAFIDWEQRSCEADAIVRGGPAAPGTMSDALKVLLSWAVNSLGLSQVNVRVRSDNPALKFYERLGFVERYRNPLRRSQGAGKIVWTEDSTVEDGSVPHLVHLTWSGQPHPLHS